MRVLIAFSFLFFLASCHKNELSGPRDDQSNAPPDVISFSDFWECHDKENFDREKLLGRLKGKWKWNLRIDYSPHTFPFDTNRVIYKNLEIEFLNDQQLVVFNDVSDTLIYNLRDIVQERVRLELPLDSIPEVEGLISLCDQQLQIEKRVDFGGSTITVWYNYFYKE